MFKTSFCKKIEAQFRLDFAFSTQKLKYQKLQLVAVQLQIKYFVDRE